MNTSLARTPAPVCDHAETASAFRLKQASAIAEIRTGEASYLIFGLTLEAAKMLGMRLEQNAIVWAGVDAVPQLILLR